MTSLVLLLVAVVFVLALAGSMLLVRLGRKLGHFDTPAMDGQIKEAPRAIPNTGGVAITAAIVLPVALLLGLLSFVEPTHALVPAALAPHLAGLAERSAEAWALLASVLAVHALGLVDDRRPLGPWVKLAIMAAIALGLTLSSPETRLLTMLDSIAGGAWLSVLLTVLWLLAVMNALNFMDNMDGLAGGVAAIASACFLVTTLSGQQWFVSAMLALVLGASAGFCVLNKPPAKLFMGDGGSLVLGLLLGFLTVRTTYVDPSTGASHLHAVLMPLVVLAAPLYDMVSVIVIRLSQGRSPMVGDLQHLSHRLVKRGLSRPAAVGLIIGLTAATGLAGLLLARADARDAWIIALQTFLLLGLLAAFERGSSASISDLEDRP